MKKLLTLVLSLIAFQGFSQIPLKNYPEVSPQQLQEANRFKLSIAIIGPDWDLYSNWGHCTMIVTEEPAIKPTEELLDDSRTITTMYDYGIFDMSQENFYSNFARGIMNYTVMDSQNPRYFAYYQYQKRSIEILHLNLPPEGKMRAINYLRENVKPENSVYKYNFFKNNCSTILRDIIDMALDGKLYQLSSNKTPYTMREWTFLYFDKHFLTEWGFDYAFGIPMDHKATRWETLFMPMEMLKVLPTITYEHNGKMVSLVSDKTVLAEAGEGMPIVREKPAKTWIPSLLLGILIGAIGGVCMLLGALHPSFRIFGGIFTAIVSTILFGLSLILMHFLLFTEFDCTYNNWNLLVIGPTTLILIISSCFYAAGKKWARTICGFGWFLCLIFALLLFILEVTSIVKQESLLSLITAIPIYTLFFLGNLFAIDPKGANE